MAGEEKRSWNVKVLTDGGPVAYLNVFDRQEAVRIPPEMTMGAHGIYRYTAGRYRWCPKDGPDVP